MPYLVTLSPQGQITIPIAVRSSLKAKKYWLDIKGGSLVLKPARIFVPADPGRKNEKKPLAEVLPREQRIIYGLICNGISSADEIHSKSRIPVDVLNSSLTFLEMKGFIRKHGYSGWEAAG